jgi:hypothetical protein
MKSSFAFFGQASQFASGGIECHLNGLVSELYCGVSKGENPYGTDLAKPTARLRVRINASQVKEVFFFSKLIRGATGMSSLWESLQGGNPIQSASWVFLVDEEHTCLQTALKRGNIGKHLARKGLPSDGLMVTLNSGVLQRRPSVDKAHLNIQANQPKMDYTWEG